MEIVSSTLDKIHQRHEAEIVREEGHRGDLNKEFHTIDFRVPSTHESPKFLCLNIQNNRQAILLGDMVDRSYLPEITKKLHRARHSLFSQALYEKVPMNSRMALMT